MCIYIYIYINNKKGSGLRKLPDLGVFASGQLRKLQDLGVFASDLLSDLLLLPGPTTADPAYST